MYCDLYLPFPTSTPGAGPSTSATSKKGKAKAVVAPVQNASRNCWEGLTQKDKEDADKSFAMAGHCKYDRSSRERQLTLERSLIRFSGVYPRGELGCFDEINHGCTQPILKPGSVSSTRSTLFGTDSRIEKTCAVVKIDHHLGRFNTAWTRE